MPIALDPNQTFPIWLQSDADASPRPTFYFRAVTIGDRRRISETPERFKSESETITADEIVNVSLDLFLEFCKGWKHIADSNGPLEFSRETIERVLTHQELWELLYSAVNNSHVSHDEKKSCESSPLLSTGSFAETAPSPSVTTNPVPVSVIT